MSLIPILFRDWWDDCLDSPLRASRILDQHFGTGITADDLLTALTASSRANRPRVGYVRPWRNTHLASRNDSGSSVNITGDKFQINLDVQQFSPEEITVKATDKCITVEGKHEEKQDEHGFIERHFVRRYMLPAGHDHNGIVSSLSSDGILSITAPKKALPPPAEEKAIPIVQTGQPMKKLPEKKAAESEKLVANGK
ncbi:protein lethal(2)essential for life-like [Topomyia yanbarensis]|uniref:protein lethal(2)essential for life-like n=1 Tax=Topomyia yanbarensis TaxID=2498891 RepID=UPI00273CAE2F|nr:protein lethal(2)essential for life-like [Topomyia yanbarensis]